MYAEGSREYVERQRKLKITGDPLRDLKAGMRFFVAFCTEDPVRYQLLFQRTIPGFEPSAESYAISVEGLEAMSDRLTEMGFTDRAALDLLTAIGTGITDQQISNDPGGDRWTPPGRRGHGDVLQPRVQSQADGDSKVTITVTPVDELPAIDQKRGCRNCGGREPAGGATRAGAAG